MQTLCQATIWPQESSCWEAQQAKLCSLTLVEIWGHVIYAFSTMQMLLDIIHDAVLAVLDRDCIVSPGQLQYLPIRAKRINVLQLRMPQVSRSMSCSIYPFVEGCLLRNVCCEHVTPGALQGTHVPMLLDRQHVWKAC